MDNSAFYFQKDSLLLPVGIVSPETELEMPLDHTAGFPAADIFSVPPLTGSGNISCVSIPPEAVLPPSWQTIPVRQMLSLLADTAAESATDKEFRCARMLRAFHIAQWRKESLFCGSCGSKNTDSPEEFARLCPVCGRLEFPRIAPAVITLIQNDQGEILLAHNKKFAPGIYSLIAGFAEAGENLEEAVARETREETAIELSDIEYVVSQPWPFPNSLMVGFTARYASGTLTPDGIEIEDVRWFAKDDLPKLPGPGSVARFLINRWLASKPDN